MMTCLVSGCLVREIGSARDFGATYGRWITLGVATDERGDPKIMTD